MTNKVILILTVIIASLFFLLQTRQLKLERQLNNQLERQLKEAESQMRVIERQNELYHQDSIKRNEEIKNAYVLQKEADKIKGDTCLNSNVDSDFARLLYNNEF